MQLVLSSYGVLSLAALLAPLPAAAFGDLDCITIETCNTGGCDPTLAPLSVTFDWANEAATVTADGSDQTLSWTSSTEPKDTLSSVIEYGDLTTTRHLLRIEANGTDITAFYTFDGTSGIETWTATCDVRTAA